MNIETFARKYRLKIRHPPGDGGERGDPLIAGAIRARDGVKCERQLYFDDEALCLMIVDGAPVARRRWEALGGRLWMGEISRDSTGRRVQDVRLIDIPLAHAGLAIRLAQAKRGQVLSDAEREARRLRGAKLHAPKPDIAAHDAV